MKTRGRFSPAIGKSATELRWKLSLGNSGGILRELSGGKYFRWKDPFRIPSEVEAVFDGNSEGPFLTENLAREAFPRVTSSLSEFSQNSGRIPTALNFPTGKKKNAEKQVLSQISERI